MTDTIRTGTAASMAGGYPDQTVEPQEPIDKATVMDDLRAALSEKIEVKEIDLVVPARATIMMRFRAYIDYDELKLWTKKSRETRQKDAAVDMKKLSILILLNTCVGMKHQQRGTDNWIEMFGQDGRPLTFGHQEVHTMLGAALGGAYQAVEKMYGHDSHIMLVAQTVSAEAGYTDLDFESGETDPLGG